MKQGSLFCFVCHVEISQAMTLHATLIIFLKRFLTLRPRNPPRFMWCSLYLRNTFDDD
jgi:hypothetical protein